MTLTEELKRNSSLRLDNGVFFQTGLPTSNEFEQLYISLRTKESRLYPDDVVRQLPELSPDEKLRHEWQVRHTSAKKLISYLNKSENKKRILEVGSGNGWLSNKLALEVTAEVLAMDINEAELLQGARVFPTQGLDFIYGDVFTLDLKPLEFDFIILASSIQYFKNISALIRHLVQLLSPAGEIHIIDSPLYASIRAAATAKERSADHFSELGHPEMKQFYFHHTMEEIGIFNYRILDNPRSVISMIKRRLSKTTHPVFPWIVIKAN